MKKQNVFIGNLFPAKKVVKVSGTKKHGGAHFILFAVVLPVHQVVGTINFPGSIAGRKERAAEIILACKGSTWVTITSTVITAANGALTNYTNALRANRPGMFTLLNNYIQTNLLDVFQAAANAQPINAIAILESGKFHVKKQHIPQIHVFEGAAGLLPGVVDLIAPGGPDSPHLHNWFSSLDSVTWKQQQSTNAGNVSLTGFPSNKIAFFKTQLSVKDVLQEMSDSIEILVR